MPLYFFIVYVLFNIDESYILWHLLFFYLMLWHLEFMASGYDVIFIFDFMASIIFINNLLTI